MTNTILNPTQGTLSANKRILHALKIAHKEKNRYAMDGLHFTPAGEVVATNGKALICAQSPEGFHLLDRARTILEKSLRAAFKGSKVSDMVGLLTLEEREGYFPPFREVLPDSDTLTRDYVELGMDSPKDLAGLMADLSHAAPAWRFTPERHKTRIECRNPGHLELSGSTARFYIADHEDSAEVEEQGYDPSLVANTIEAFRGFTPDGKHPPAHAFSMFWPARNRGKGKPMVLRYRSQDWDVIAVVMPLNLKD